MGPARRRAHEGRWRSEPEGSRHGPWCAGGPAAGLHARDASRRSRRPRSQAGKVPLIYQKKRSFRIPFHIDEQGQARMKEVQLWVSEDSGFHWEPRSRTTPGPGQVHVPHLARWRVLVRDPDADGGRRVLAADEPDGRAEHEGVVDTVAALARARAGRPAREHGDGAVGGQGRAPRSQDAGPGIPGRRGEGLAEGADPPARRSWARRAGRPGRPMRFGFGPRSPTRPGTRPRPRSSCPRERPRHPDLAAIDPESSSAPTVEQISRRPARRSPRRRNSRRSRRVRRPGRPLHLGPVLAVRSPRRTRGDDGLASRSLPPAPDWDGGAGQRRRQHPGDQLSAARPRRTGVPQPVPDGRAGRRHPAGLESAGGFPAAGVSPGGSNPGREPDHAGPEPPVQAPVRVEDAGPNGPASRRALAHPGRRTDVDPRGEDPDKISPFEVDLGGEGTFGISLVARSASGLGDQPPAPGDPPQTWVEVDSTPPVGPALPAADRHGPSRRQGGDHLAGQRPSPRAPVGLALLASRPARLDLAADRRGPGEHGPVRLDRSSELPGQVPHPGRGRRYRRPSGRSRDDRRGPGHRRSQPAPEPDHRPGPERPRRRRPGARPLR